MNFLIKENMGEGVRHPSYIRTSEQNWFLIHRNRYGWMGVAQPSSFHLQIRRINARGTFYTPGYISIVVNCEYCIQGKKIDCKE